MKDFLKNVAATVVGVFLTFGIILAFTMLSLVGMIASGGSEKVSVEDNSVLVINLSGEITEKSPAENPFAQFAGGVADQTGLNDILAAIDKAKENDDIKGIYLESGYIQADYATLQEIHDKLLEFKAAKKWIVAYSDHYLQAGYYLASVADKVYLNPMGMADVHGLGGQPMFLKDLYAKVGVKYNIVKVGTYKSYTEQYTEDHMSDANREQVEAYMNGIWKHLSTDIAKSRGITPERLNQLCDDILYLKPATYLKQVKLVDELLYADQVKAAVKKRLGLKDDEKICQLTVSDMKHVDGTGRHSTKGDEVAVYYCEGSIVMNDVTGMVTGGGIIASHVCRDLEDLKNDDDVKAVVLRINSGGGDAYASEQLWHYVSELKKVKPVVVSMGGVAASGAYYMSCNASWVIADPTTVTGSIGIFGAFPDATGLITEKLGVKFDEVKTNKNSNFSPMAYTRPLNAEEIDALQVYVNQGYQLFRKRVADGRKMKVEAVEKIAQGRVWTGEDAKARGLVDQLGNLDAAITKAAQLAKLNDYHTSDYPAAPDFMEQLMAQTSQKSYLDEQLRLVLGSWYEPFIQLRTLNQQSPIQARMPFVINLK